MWESTEAKRYVQDIVDLVAEDWTTIDALTAPVFRLVGVDASLEVKARAMAELTGLLIDRGVVPGDMDLESGQGATFLPWPGACQERMDRMKRKILELGEMPWPNPWFSIESGVTGED